MDGFLQKVKGLDAFPKVNEDFYKRTLSGGVVTLLSTLVMLLLFISETTTALVNAALVIIVSRFPDFSLDIAHIIKVVEQEKPKCIFFTSPNNPDGSVINDDDLLKILDLSVLVVLDEAYVEF